MTLAILSLGFAVPGFLTATLLVAGLFLFFAYMHLEKHQAAASKALPTAPHSS
jgi:hypothetical protein